MIAGIPLDLQSRFESLSRTAEEAVSRLRIEEDAVAKLAIENKRLKQVNALLLTLCEQLQSSQAGVQVIADHLAGGLVATLQQYQAGDSRTYAELSESVVEFDPEGDLVPPVCIGRVRIARAEGETVPVMFRLRRPFYDAEVIE